MLDRPGKVTFFSLWREFLPLSVGDVTMAFGDPAVTGTLAQLPAARVNIAATGIAKAIAVFFESPIIMILHASNALAPYPTARKSLWRLTLFLMATLSGLLALLSLPSIFGLIAKKGMGIDSNTATIAGRVLILFAVWPAAIACRRYFQGILIRYGHGSAVAKGGFGRLLLVALILSTGFVLKIDGALLASLALVGGVVGETVYVLIATKLARLSATDTNVEEPPSAPKNFAEVSRFYRPLAMSMVVVWGGRAALLGIVSRATDGPLALAVWPAAWGLVLLVANSTRMVQQVIIRNRAAAQMSLLFAFAASVGLVGSSLILALSLSFFGEGLVLRFLGDDIALARGVFPVLLLCSATPLLVAIQNALQGLLIADGKTARINEATWIGTTSLLFTAYGLMRAGFGGAISAAYGILLALVLESLWLGGRYVGGFGLIRIPGKKMDRPAAAS